MKIKKTFERKGKNHHENFYAENQGVMWWIFCKNGHIETIRERTSAGEKIITDRPEFLSYEVLCGK